MSTALSHQKLLLVVPFQREFFIYRPSKTVSTIKVKMVSVDDFIKSMQNFIPEYEPSKIGNIKVEDSLKMWFQVRDNMKDVIDHTFKMLNYVTLCAEPSRPYIEYVNMHNILKNNLEGLKNYFLSSSLPDLRFEDPKYVYKFTRIIILLNDIKNKKPIHLRHFKLIYSALRSYASYCFKVAENHIGLLN